MVVDGQVFQINACIEGCFRKDLVEMLMDSDDPDRGREKWVGIARTIAKESLSPQVHLGSTKICSTLSFLPADRDVQDK